ncbi:helix-turn-helix domain-containing protein [Clostridium sp.]|uniref:helix-turn-helix domain-containing protein n=1 Tax=Clostridium sp. TaxID=1506 RepID=UPI00284B8359|nr:helix-turn-helix domain-containing protein [Clostridium sp.]MDR3596536.1 helix-turn-helix domain-containing protein [Clostridium sp.]
MKQELLLISRDEFEQILKDIIRKEFDSILGSKKETTTEDDDLISFNEALRLLKISRPTLFKHMKNGIIPYRKVGRRLLFPKQTILKKIIQNKKEYP